MTEAPLAEPGQRLLARIVDTLIVGVPVILVVRALESGPTVDVIAPPALAGCMLLYEAVQLALWGRTLGKRVAGIEVVVAVPGAIPVSGETAAGAHDGDPDIRAAGATPTSPENGAEASATPTTRPPANGSEPTTELPAGGSDPTTGLPAGGSEPITGLPAGGSEATTEPAATPDAGTDGVPISEGFRLDVVRAVVRAAVYSLPIAVRPIPVAGLLAGIFWLANAGALYEGKHRQAVHDRLTGTLVVKRSPTDSSAF